jgi:GNAT superfamily N-acetyltransferase
MSTPAPVQWERDGYVVSTDAARLDLAAIHGYLSRSYWAAGIPLETLARALDHSLCFGLYRDTTQVGFARMVTDRATFAYLADVYVLEPHRGRGLGKWLVGCVLSHPALHGLRRSMLATRDAHELYRQFGYRPLAHPERLMEIVQPDIYRQPAQV